MIFPSSIVFERKELLEKSNVLKANEENIEGAAATCARLCKKCLLSIFKINLFLLPEIALTIILEHDYLILSFYLEWDYFCNR